MAAAPVFVAFMLFGLKLDHVNPWDGSAIPTARALPTMERFDPYDGEPIHVTPAIQLELDTESPWVGQGGGEASF